MVYERRANQRRMVQQQIYAIEEIRIDCIFLFSTAKVLQSFNTRNSILDIFHYFGKNMYLCRQNKKLFY